jgi:oxygen-independent coproporphyrinogen-3 oxidase
MEIGDQLLNKYNVPVPRYTSYPPANQFTESFSESSYLTLLKESNSRKPESMALYIHIPFCKRICHYCGCNACSIGDGALIKPYMEALRKEIELVSMHLDKNRPVTQLHYGGGTPNSLDIRYIESLNEFLFSNFNFVEKPEIAIECNPAYLDYKYIDRLISSGFNRFSMGIQDFDNNILKLVNRKPSAIPPTELFRYLKSAKKEVNVNFDFIYGLPGQTVASFSETIDQAIDIRPDRLVTFSYAHVPWVKKHQVILEKRGLPSPGDKMQMFLSAYKKLIEAGYQPIGLDHFVLPADDLYLAVNSGNLHRNFQGYCTRKTTGQVYAFGVSAISQLVQGYSQNLKEIVDYNEAIHQGKLPVERGYVLSDEQILTREVITELMCNKKISFSKIAEMQKVSVEELKSAMKTDETALNEFLVDGLINYSSGTIEVTEKGTLFIRNIAASLDKEYQMKTQTYSKPV